MLVKPRKQFVIDFAGGEWPRKELTFRTLNDCLEYLASEFDFGEVFQEFRTVRTFYGAPHCREDRILIWEVTKDFERVVWHYSGSDYRQDASDLPGGPLPQGKLLGQDFTLYEMAVA